ncbi:MAG: hypothetical protein J7L03_04220 [Caldisericaceae bacterium]|nr:hypothetical protein [Caldisericaceae bacterium]
MTETEGRYLIGAILISFGITYALSVANIVNSPFWLFVSCLLVMEGAYYTAKGITLKKDDISFPLAVLFLGIFELLFLFNLIHYSFSVFIAAVLLSIGLGLVVSNFLAKYSYRKMLSGIIVTVFGALFAISSMLNVTDKVDRWIRGYGIGILIIILGILIIFPPKGGNRER